MDNVSKALKDYKGNAQFAMKQAIDYVDRDMVHTPPTIPWDKGNLFGSRFRTPMGKTGIIFGFGANYAVYVHERVKGAKWGDGVVGDVKWTKPGSGPKFFEEALKRNETQMLEIIGKYIRK